MEALMQLQIITPDHLMCDESVKMVEMANLKQCMTDTLSRM